jgi:transposase-like protein
MPSGYPVLNSKQRAEIIQRVKEKGEKVSNLAKEYGVNPKNIYNLLKRQVNQPNVVLELAKIKRERDALLQIVGELVFENKKNLKKKI